MPAGPGKSNRVAIVGASSLRGKELKQVLEDRNFPASEVILLDQSLMAGTLTEAGGEPTFIRELREDSFDGVRFAFLAGTVFEAERSWPAARRAGATVIDLTGAVTASDRWVAGIPSLSSAFPSRAAGTANDGSADLLYLSPSTAVIVASTLAAGLAKWEPQPIVLTLFPPVSERDQPGIEELESQTTNLLSFRPIEQSVFDAQVAFNLLSCYGTESSLSLGDLRRQIARDVSAFLAGRAPVPAIQLIQAPVFYGYAFNAYAEFSSPVVVDELASAFRSLGVRIAGLGDRPPTNVSVAGESEIQLGAIDRDPSVASGVWLWGVADNLRLAAANAVRIAEELVVRPASV